MEIVSGSHPEPNPRLYRNPNRVNRLSAILGDSGVLVPALDPRTESQNGLPSVIPTAGWSIMRSSRDIRSSIPPACLYRLDARPGLPADVSDSLL